MLDLNGFDLTITNPGDNVPAIQVPADATLTIRANDENDQLMATGGYYAAAIGGRNSGATGAIPIEGGTIEARGGAGGAASAPA